MNIDQQIAQAQEKLLRASDGQLEAARTEMADLLEQKRLNGTDRIVSGLDAGESAAYRRLQGKVSVTDYFSAAMSGAPAAGAASELNAEIGIGADRMPVEFLIGRDIQNAVTGIDTTAGQPSGWLDLAFSGSVIDRLGISRSMVSDGKAEYPAVTAIGTPAQRGKEEAASAAAWTVAVTEAVPKGMTLHIEYANEDAYRNPGMEDALSRNMRMAAMDRMDHVVILGDTAGSGTDSDIDGLTGLAGVDEQTLSQSNKAKAVNTVGAFSAMLDGKYAGGYGDLRIVASEGAGQLWASTSGESTGAQTLMLSELLQRNGVDYMIRTFESATTNGKFGAVVGKGRNMEGAAHVSVWRDVQLIRDQYTGAAKRQVKLTANLFWDFQVLRAANFARVKFVT